jgi:hypothetical protein
LLLIGCVGGARNAPIYGIRAVRLLRIVPDDTKFDFTRFRRISFPLSALLSIMQSHFTSSMD